MNIETKKRINNFGVAAALVGALSTSGCDLQPKPEGMSQQLGPLVCQVGVTVTYPSLKDYNLSVSAGDCFPQGGEGPVGTVVAMTDNDGTVREPGGLYNTFNLTDQAGVCAVSGSYQTGIERGVLSSNLTIDSVHCNGKPKPFYFRNGRRSPGQQIADKKRQSRSAIDEMRARAKRSS